MEKTRNASQSVMERVSKTLAVADVHKVVLKATETQNTPPSAATCGYAAPNSLSKDLEIRAFDPSRLLFLMREISTDGHREALEFLNPGISCYSRLYVNSHCVKRPWRPH